ncbi:MAG TPA: hypothetical protein PK082_07185, partial [Phycisphaerae bacterium]|nr:hypothetical protein [Phycisphaerae bacterium]
TAVAENISAASWMKDSRRLVVVRKETMTKWKELAAVLPADRQAEIAKLAESLRQQLMANKGDLGQFQPTVPPENFGDLAMILMYLRDEAAGNLPETLGENWKPIEELKIDLCRLTTCPAVASAPMGKPLAVALTCLEPQASPDGKAIAYHGSMIDRAMAENGLVVVPTDGSGPPRVVAQRTAAWAGWSPDGRHLAYASANLPKSRDGDTLRLGTISRSEIIDDTGRMPPSDMPFPREDLAGILFHEEAKVTCLPDGRILFSSVELDLPATTADMPQQMSLFCVNPKQPTVTRLLPRQAQAQLVEPLMYFSVSPNGKSAAILGNKGQVSVVSLETGKARTIVESQPNGPNSLAVPVWRSDTELTFIAPPNSHFNDTGRPEVVTVELTGQGPPTARCLSKDWSQEVRLGILEQPKPETQPAK